jgi:hypothetical protein
METKLQIIETPDYVLVVSDEEIKNDEYYVSWETNYSTEPKERYVIYVRGSGLNGTNPKKIIAYQPKNNAPELDLPLLPEIVVEDDVRKLALTLYKEPLNKEGEVRTQLVGHGSTPFGFNKWFKAFKKGYKSATKKYSENDLRSAIMQSFLSGVERIENYSEVEYGIIQSLKTPTPKWFVAEIDGGCLNYVGNGGDKCLTPCDNMFCYPKGLKVKIINGKTYLVGTYLFE